MIDRRCLHSHFLVPIHAPTIGCALESVDQLEPAVKPGRLIAADRQLPADRAVGVLEVEHHVNRFGCPHDAGASRAVALGASGGTPHFGRATLTLGDLVTPAAGYTLAAVLSAVARSARPVTASFA